MTLFRAAEPRAALVCCYASLRELAASRNVSAVAAYRQELRRVAVILSLALRKPPLRVRNAGRFKFRPLRCAQQRWCCRRPRKTRRLARRRRRIAPARASRGARRKGAGVASPRRGAATENEVTTLFHETGHGLQHMLTEVEHAPAAGINGVESVSYTHLTLPTKA